MTRGLRNIFMRSVVLRDANGDHVQVGPAHSEIMPMLGKPQRIGRLEFPVARCLSERPHGSFTVFLGQPDTLERDIEPLRRGQAVQICGWEIPIARVGEGLVEFDDWSYMQSTPDVPNHGSEILEDESGLFRAPTRLVRPAQWVWPVHDD